MQKPDYIPADYSRIVVVDSLLEVFDRPFTPTVNCYLLPGRLSGDFNALSRRIVREQCVIWSGIPQVNMQRLEEIIPLLPAEEEIAAQTLLKDMSGLKPHGPEIRLTLASHYNKNLSPYIFHGDGLSRVMRCYNDPVTEWVRNADAEVDPDPRFGSLGSAFREKVGIHVFRFRPGDFWAQAGKTEISGTDPFIHRAPPMKPDDPPRLLLIAVRGR